MDITKTAGAEASVDESRRSRQSFGRTVRAYVALMKPRVLELLLVTTVPVMILAQGGFPDVWLVIATVIGVFLSVLLGSGLMAAAYFSDKSGIDQSISDSTKPRDDRP